jgi:integrase
MPQDQITKGWKSALQRAGIEPTFRWHDLRHTWASWHVMSGTPLEVLQKLGGWSSLTMVMRYAHLAPDHLAGYANNARPYSPLKDVA